jgi:hypothetical protein
LSHIAPAVLDGSPPPNTNLAARSGEHNANVGSGSGSSGSSLGSTSNFGCGGSCHQAHNNIYSIFLNQQGTGNPKSTATLYEGTNCNGHQVAHAGIYNSEHVGCTNLNFPAKSYYLYHNC